MEAIRVAGLHKTFGHVQALVDLHLAVEEGTVFGFLGPNGAGKTTTIRILTGLAQPTSCDMLQIAGLDARTERRKIASLIGYLPEAPRFYPWMTATEFLDFVGQVFGLSAAARAKRTEELLALVGLTEARDRRLGGFSRGMAQRLGIAQALVNSPPVLFLDEPVSALDPLGRREILALIDGLRTKHTVLMSSHILADIERVCDNVGIINKGRMIAVAPQSELVERYAVPVFEFESDPSTADRVAEWLAGVRDMAWIDSIGQDGAAANGAVTNGGAASGGPVRVRVHDVRAAKRELLASLLQAGVIVTRYEIVRPSLEEIFIHLIEEEELL